MFLQFLYKLEKLLSYLYRSFFYKTSFFCLLLPAVALRSTRATRKGRGKEERGEEREEASCRGPRK